jgi:hypothetical protein
MFIWDRVAIAWGISRADRTPTARSMIGSGRTLKIYRERLLARRSDLLAEEATMH